MEREDVNTMEGILFDIEMFASPVTVLLGLVLLGTKRPVLLVKPEKVHIAHHVDEQEVN